MYLSNLPPRGAPCEGASIPMEPWDVVRYVRYLELRFSRERARRLEDARVRICWVLRYDTS